VESEPDCLHWRSGVTKQNKDRAWSQLGTSGSGNHFVEFGLFTAHGEISRAGMPAPLSAGTYVTKVPEKEKEVV